MDIELKNFRRFSIAAVSQQMITFDVKGEGGWSYNNITADEARAIIEALEEAVEEVDAPLVKCGDIVTTFDGKTGVVEAIGTAQVAVRVSNTFYYTPDLVTKV